MHKNSVAIIIFVFLSYIGILYIQWAWINTTQEVHRNKFNFQIENSFPGIKQDLQAIVAQTSGIKPELANFDELAAEMYYWNYWIDKADTNQIKETIKNRLAQNEILFPFEWALIYQHKMELNSNAFNKETLYRSFQLSLTKNDAYILVIQVDNSGQSIFSRYRQLILSSVFSILIISTAFFIIIRSMNKQKKISEIKTDFINNMTHEFKTPLSSISLATDILKLEKVKNDPSLVAKYTSHIEQEHKRLTQQIEKILQAAKLENNNIELNQTIIQANSAIDNIAHHFELRATESGGKIIKDLSATKNIIYADEVHFNNMINNLLDNALKYTPQNPIIKISTNNDKSDYLTIVVEDNGIGMDKDTVKHIFDKFYRAHTGKLHNVKGFGLGLSYVHSIVEAHNGRIKVESIPGKGSTFTIDLINNVEKFI